MPVNLEIKVKVPSFKKIVTLLEALPAAEEPLLLQKDIYYIADAGLLKVRIENGAASLIHYNRNEAGKNRWSQFRVMDFTCEKPETFFDSFLKREAVVEKKRRLFWFNNTRIHLDTVKQLGSFLELETIVSGSKPEAEKRFRFLSEYLHLKEYPELRLSYRDLIIKSNH